MIKFKDLEFSGGAGRQARVDFPNGYSASIINDGYGADRGLYEMGVVWSGRLVYDTPITDDVLGHLTEADVERHLDEIAKPPEREAAQ